jgi:hypothetical protein
MTMIWTNPDFGLEPVLVLMVILVVWFMILITILTQSRSFYLPQADFLCNKVFRWPRLMPMLIPGAASLNELMGIIAHAWFAR